MAIADAVTPAHRALAAEQSGFADVDGVRIAYEVFGQGEQTLLLLPPWAIVHSRFWKLQVPYLARHFRVITFDPRGNGASDRPASTEAYGPRLLARDAVAVLDAVGAEHCVVVVHCGSAQAGLLFATEHSDRVRGSLFFSPALPISPPLPERTGHSFDAELDVYDGWAKTNRHYWRQDFRGFLEFFFGKCLSEPHCTKQIEDSIAWGLETDPETLEHTLDTPDLSREEIDDLLGRLPRPLAVIHGVEDLLVPPDRGAAFSELTGAELLELEGVGHLPMARHPVVINHAIRDFGERAYERPREPVRWRRAIRRPKRALYLSSPIGLGHAWRDVAIARELRVLHPDLEIDWLAQDPVTRVLEASGERIHPASVLLSNESRHIAAESREHELNVFEAWRRMDEILMANFMVFDDVVRDNDYDLWIGDEAWELDYYLHENPELKTTAYCFLTDFVGWLPMPAGGAEEARLTADYNAEMIEQIARFPRVRDRAIFVGEAADVVPHDFGPGLGAIRPWVEAHFDFSGYVLAPAAGAPADREALRAELGWRPDERVCVVTVGGSGVGGGLLGRVIDAYAEARAKVPELRMVVVCGPRIDPASIPAPDGVELVGYVHELSKQLAACDVAVTQGGLTTCMELAAAKTPFLYAPLRRHFEQNLHVRHRLERYGAGRAIDLASDDIAGGIVAALHDAPRPADVERDGAARAAGMIADLL
jgi:pimeloyl-ACP methyl ester carboxylesterase/predicted glycosyltransferase